jgi:alkylhydroperoxidase family enzyme
LVDDADRDALSQQGLSQEDIFDLAETVAFFNLSNRMASATDMIPNREYHRQTRADWDKPTPD